MLRVPRTEEIAASGVGMQMWRCEETAVRKGEVGSQWSGSDAERRLCNNGGNMVYVCVYLMSSCIVPM